jgi:hypothetical protein
VFIIYVETKTKKQLIQQAAQKGRSLCAEVVVLLLEKYRPEGWRDALEDIVDRSRLCNNRATVVNDDRPETIGLAFPEGLREKIEKVARKNCRSLNAEIIHFLEGENERRSHIFRE